MFHENWYSDAQVGDLQLLVDKVSKIPKKGVFIEVGCWEGKSTVALANRCYPEILFCNDTWKGNVEESKATGKTHPTETILKERNVLMVFKHNMNTCTRGNYSIVQEDCLTWLASVQDPIQFIHIDASHEYESVKKTVNLVKSRVVPGGIICGADFISAHQGRLDLHGGVERAVRESFGNEFQQKGNLWYWQNLVFPITFSIPESKMVTTLPPKTKTMSGQIPTNTKTYTYEREADYYGEYQSSYFATTKKKGGWDCLRHYEIVANGCLPYFENDPTECPNRTMALWSKTLWMDARRLYDAWKGTPEDHNTWERLMNQSMDHVKKHLTTKRIADYLLDTTGHHQTQRILFLSGDLYPDYLRCLTLHGLKERMGAHCHDYPQVSHLYENCSIPNASLYGKGMTYAKLLDPSLHDDRLDATVEKDIADKVYDLIIYGSVHRGMPFYEQVASIYEPHQIILLCGEDIHDNHWIDCIPTWISKGHFLLVRELV